MRTTTALILATFLCAAAHAADGPLGLGPLRLGMSYDQARAALPNADWRPTVYGVPWRPTSPFPRDHEMTEMKATQALVIAGEAFDVVYEDATWDRYRLSVSHYEGGEAAAADCRKRVTRFMQEIEAAVGQLDAEPVLGGDPTHRETIRIGRASQAVLKHHVDGGFGIEASRMQGATSVRASGDTARYNILGSERGCRLEAELKMWPERPPQGTIAADALELARTIGIGPMHHSLDATPPPPPQGVDIDLACTIEHRDGRLTCKAVPETGAAALPFVDAALFRAKTMRVAHRTRDGRWTPGELTKLRIRIAPEDRQTVGAFDETKSSLLVEWGRPDALRYPDRAVDADASAEVNARCIVQSDGSLICPEIKVVPPKFENEFKAAAMRFLMSYRFATKLSNGESSAGVGRRMQIGFKIG